MSNYCKKKKEPMIDSSERFFKETHLVQERVYQNVSDKSGSVFRTIQDNRVTEVIVELVTPKLLTYNEYGDEGPAKVSFTILLNGDEIVKDEWYGHARNYSKSYTIKRKEPGIMEINIRKDSPDNDNPLVKDSLFWENYTEVIDSNNSNTNIVSINVEARDPGYNWNGISVLFECNYDSEELVNCYSDGCDKLGFDPIDEYCRSAWDEAIPSDKVEKLRQAGCDLFSLGDPLRMFPRGWAQLFMWIAKYGDNFLTYKHFQANSVFINAGDVSYEL